MKALKIVLIACSLAAAGAHAQTATPPADTQQVAQADVQHANARAREGRMVPAPKKTDNCVGPVSFCNIYAGS
ncbi:hypothetical protein [Paraburkholderia sp.]|jgi:hypothetical protein|uniref:hypothetical protein n=1 Tax=Paraburkholderia sp. TaxID=1926495 RepID=UPI002F42D0F1